MPVTHIYGTSEPDVINGTSGEDVLNGYGGADTMLGGAGNDIYYVDNAGDQVSENADEGTDRVYSSIDFTLPTNVENLTLTGTALTGTGNAGSNTIIGNAENNVLNGAGGADLMQGGGGDDIFYVDDAGDRAAEAAGGGADHVYSSVSFALWTNVENLTLTGTADLTGVGNAGSNILTGNSGNNVLNGYGGADTMLGGAGNDIYYVDNAGDQVSENAGEGTDWVYSSIDFTLPTNVENLTLTGTALTGTGNAGSNTIIGNAENNVLNGAGGADLMQGGGGDDIFYVDDAGDRAAEAAGGGADHVYSSVSFALWTNVENLTLTGTADLTGVGNAGSNILTGNSGSNVLNGDGGADTMLGGAGNDIYYVDNAGDQVLENAGEGTEWVYSSIDFTLPTGVENVILTGTAATDATGNGQANEIFGNEAANRIVGGDGDDYLFGGAGNDVLTGGSGADEFYFDTAPDSVNNWDTIVDFTVADDLMMLDMGIFTELGGTSLQALDASAFQQGTAATDADDRIIYDSATGNVYYDADGSGAVDAVQFAQVTAGTDLSAADFWVY